MTIIILYCLITMLMGTAMALEDLHRKEYFQFFLYIIFSPVIIPSNLGFMMKEYINEKKIY